MTDTIMFWINVICSAGSVICLIASIIASRKSLKYFNKSKHISLVVQCSNSVEEMKQASNLLIELLQYTNPSRNSRGNNVSKAVCQISQDIQRRLMNINSQLSPTDAEEFQKKLKDSVFDCNDYLVRIASGSYIEISQNGSEVFKSDSKFIKCQELFGDATRYLNDLLDTHQEQIK